LRLPCAGAAAAVELGGAGGREQGLGTLRQLHIDIEYVAADHSARWVQQVDVAYRALGIERPLHRQWPAVPALRQQGAVAGIAKSEAQLGPPTHDARQLFGCGRHFGRSAANALDAQPR
jgi:hypothetical protein